MLRETGDSRGRRKAPSPLHPAASATTLPHHDEPRSPREKLDALLAEEANHHNAASLPASPPAASPPASPKPAMATRPHRPDTRPQPPIRNHSIDSAASSVSSSPSQTYRPPAGHAHRPSQDTTLAHPPDMARLLAAAGSPEAALLALWKEKQSTAGHNAQLWRLVEKQRAMIIGLQKDLERSLRDKDRYRRKVKELADDAPPVPGALLRSDTSGSSPRPDHHQPLEEPAKPTDRLSPLAREHPAVPDSQLAASPAPSPAPSADAEPASPPDSAVNSPTDYSVKPLLFSAKGPSLNAIVQEISQAAQSEPPSLPRRVDAPPPAAIDTHLQPPQLSITHATPILGGNGFESPPRKPTQPARKAPPAPLNLSRPLATSAHLHQAVHGNGNGNDSDSDYDDVLEVDEIPIVDRGRRKTREEDDRIREAAMMKNDEARSKSKKSSRSKSKTKVPVEGADRSVAAPVPPTPRLFNPLQAGLPLSPRHPPAGSLNAMLSPALLSPGLPSSPRPGDRPLGSPLPRFPKQSLASPPMSPTGMIPAARSLPLPNPPPPNAPQSFHSPPAIQVDHSAKPQTGLPPDYATATLGQPSPSTTSTSSSPTSLSIPDAEHVYRGLVSEQYPGFLLPPNALPSIEVKVFSSRLRPSRMSFISPRPQEEDPVFILAIYARSDSKQLWRMEKTIAALPALDAQLRLLTDFNGQLPDRSLFSGHAPARIDARGIALNQYFDAILETNMNEKAALIVCEFFSTDVIGAQNGHRLTPEPTITTSAAPLPKASHRKEGYLTKRGKNFGGWKARHFVLDGPEFRYYEAEGGTHLGTIKLHNAQIGKQSQQQSNHSPQRRDDSEDNQYRHAFLILEPKRKDSSSLVRHVLCAESDEERDAWVEALLQHVDLHEETSPMEGQPSPMAPLQKSQPSQEFSHSQRKDSPDMHQQARLQGISYDDTVAAEAPVRGPNHREGMGGKPSRGSPKLSSFSQDNLGHFPAISGPSNGTPIRDAENWGNKAPTGPTSVKDKKRSIFGFRGRGSNDLAPVQISSPMLSISEPRMMHASRSIFGIPLQEAVEVSQAIGVSAQLPSVVFRCLEYLNAKKCINEEGIFRLSGSNIVIRGLRERFNTEGDVKLLGDQYYDVHAIASLLKLYLRELPASILTRDLHIDFLKVLDMDERSKKIQTFNVLVHKLPAANFQLLRHLSSLLIEVVDNCELNKMTVRNVGIVFAPTLNIPAPLISFFLTDFPDIFGTALDEANSPIHEIRVNNSLLGGDAIRSPRRQMFSDLPTPAYNETTFQQSYERPLPQYQNSSGLSHSPPPQQQQQQQLQPQQQQQQQQQQTAGYDAGFIPIRPSYEPPSYDTSFQGDGYGSLNSAVQSGTPREQRQRRRESGMLLMNMGMANGQRKGSNGSAASQRPRDDLRMDARMVREESAFE
ncbi:RhoGAP-domain-containing protein [Dothidotthia symphoricarpi CBS 119687]|uniref:RhoGAP-domain-containing protein n=1 Tax=Dothidotthia symphoricarpi CBS 119687 TaxID=1392245 RepID=A0A6A6AS65_9PLEO|nr:RhoGAP-domain-containing protein [Dothidotthia symphoricarpi CBS 119687]KAF2133998.1 RhoGAP-domain-containing protein [Dothidotthia symphoricarpi CBS 119687]